MSNSKDRIFAALKKNLDDAYNQIKKLTEENRGLKARLNKLAHLEPAGEQIVTGSIIIKTEKK